MKILTRIKEFLITAFLVFALILSALWAFLKTPIHYIAYKRSNFFKDFKRKYRLFICVNPDYRMYNLIRKHNLPIQYIPSNPQQPEDGGYFVYKRTLIIHNLTQVEYRENINKWVFRQAKSNTEAPMPIFEYVMDALTLVNSLPGHEECTQMLLLLNRKQVLKADLPRAEADRRFLMHSGKDLSEILDAYIVTHPFG